MTFGEQLTQEIKCPHGKKTTPTWLDMHILQIRSSLQTNGVQHWIHFIIIMSNIWINFIKNMFKNEMDPVFWVLFFSEALGPIPNWILFRFPLNRVAASVYYSVWAFTLAALRTNNPRGTRKLRRRRPNLFFEAGLVVVVTEAFEVSLHS